MSIVLPRLPQFPPSHSELQVWWQQVVETVEAQEAAQDEIIADLQQVTTDLAAVQAEQAVIIADLEAALADILDVQRRDAISSSYTVPSAVLTASDAGTDATITIADHTRYYGDETSLAVIGGSILTLAYSTTYAIYYDDTTRSDTTPTYTATTDRKIAQYNYAAGRHYVGEVTTPAAGGGDTTGGTEPIGGGGGLTP